MVFCRLNWKRIYSLRFFLFPSFLSIRFISGSEQNIFRVIFFCFITTAFPLLIFLILHFNGSRIRRLFLMWYIWLVVKLNWYKMLRKRAKKRTVLKNFGSSGYFNLCIFAIKVQYCSVFPFFFSAGPINNWNHTLVVK